mmetsp:Transcript_35265/g.35924  ORF Transcript_35265/g.35924 Transcript_35265/m.35924 type:complete len:309 (-) Transcript_35265:98-1024(-)
MRLNLIVLLVGLCVSLSIGFVHPRLCCVKAHHLKLLSSVANSNADLKRAKWTWPVHPQIYLFRKTVNIWGILFAVQSFLLAIPWMFGMLAILPFKSILRDKFDPNGVRIDSLGRIWGRMILFPHSAPRITGKNNIPNKNETCIYIANHKSWLDVPMIGGYLPPMKFVAKRELIKVPFIGQALVWGRHILIDRGNVEKRTDVLEQCIDRLRNGVSVCLFPEGTRSSLPNEEMLPFHKGAFLIAQLANKPIVPISVSHSAGLMPSTALLPVRPGLGMPRIHVHPPIMMTGQNIKDVMKQVREILASEIEI